MSLPDRAFGAILALSLASCSSDYAVDGTWERGGVSGDHSGSYVMQLRRDRDRITGLACRLSGGHQIFRDRPVEGHYPRLSFDSSLDNSGSPQLELMIVGDNLISGTDGDGIKNTFVRAASDRYVACASATP